MPYELKNVKEMVNPTNVHTYVNKGFRDVFDDYEKYHVTHYNMTFVPDNPEKRHIFVEAMIIPELNRAGYTINNSNVYWVDGIQSKEDLIDVVENAVQIMEKEGIVADRLLATIKLQNKVISKIVSRKHKRICNKRS